MTGEWTVVSDKREARTATTRKDHDAPSEEAICRFLANFKVAPCSQAAGWDHDPRMCTNYHSEDDRRRNPYESYYDVDDARNRMEKMYHPKLFRTFRCDRATTCIFGQLCAHAHSDASLRSWTKAQTDYETYSFQEAYREVSTSGTVAAHLPLAVSMELSSEECEAQAVAMWSQQHISPSTKTIKVSSSAQFVLENSVSLMKEIRMCALADGLGTVEYTPGTRSLLLRGLEVDSIDAVVNSLLYPPSRFFQVKKVEYAPRIMTKLVELLKKGGTGAIVPSSARVLVQVLKKQRGIQLTAVPTSSITAEAAIEQVLDKINFWVSQEKYGDFRSCGCCFGDFNEDQGVTCKNGHFYCSVEGCISGAASSQIQYLSTREEGIVCPECEVEYDERFLFHHLDADTHANIKKAILDGKVKKEAEKLSNEFDQRLEDKVNELLGSYSGVSEVVKVKARMEAQKIRNDILNLTCPHCQTAYFEFTGCMAVGCSSCKGNFCGYCHEKFTSSGGCHDHVRQCLMNETSNGSYYANPDEIKESQRKYRTRKLKKYLTNHKKDIQNAIVIELQKDLKDLEIKPAALFEIGNLRPLP